MPLHERDARGDAPSAECRATACAARSIRERGEPTVRWIEARGRDSAVSVSTVPLDLAPILREDLFKRATTTVVTSATLATDGRFDFLDVAPRARRSRARAAHRHLPSPFDYREQAILAVPTDVPAPNVDARGPFQRGRAR